MSCANSIRAAGKRVAIFAAASVQMWAAQGGIAAAADWYTGAAPPKPNDDWIVAIDGSASATSDGSYFTGLAVTVAAGGTLKNSVFRVRAEGLGGTYSFDSGPAAVPTRADQVEGAILGGYEWLIGRSSLQAYGGLAVRDSHFSNSDPSHPPDGTAFGFKGVLQYYLTPSDQTMFSAYGSYSSVYNAYYTRLKWGVAPFGSFYIGPEIGALGDDYYRQWRLGMHISAVRFGAMQFGLSGGYTRNQDDRGGAYGMLDVHMNY